MVDTKSQIDKQDLFSLKKNNNFYLLKDVHDGWLIQIFFKLLAFFCEYFLC